MISKSTIDKFCKLLIISYSFKILTYSILEPSVDATRIAGNTDVRWEAKLRLSSLDGEGTSLQTAMIRGMNIV